MVDVGKHPNHIKRATCVEWRFRAAGCHQSWICCQHYYITFTRSCYRDWCTCLIGTWAQVFSELRMIPWIGSIYRHRSRKRVRQLANKYMSTSWFFCTAVIYCETINRLGNAFRRKKSVHEIVFLLHHIFYCHRSRKRVRQSVNELMSTVFWNAKCVLRLCATRYYYYTKKTLRSNNMLLFHVVAIEIDVLVTSVHELINTLLEECQAYGTTATIVSTLWNCFPDKCPLRSPNIYKSFNISDPHTQLNTITFSHTWFLATHFLCLASAFSKEKQFIYKWFQKVR